MADAQLGELAAIEKELRSLGMEIDSAETQDQIGMIIGTASSAVAEVCRHVRGVSSIDIDHRVQL